MPIRYPLALGRDSDSGLVSCPDRSDVDSFGDGEADAPHHGSDAVAEAVAGRLDRFQRPRLPTSG